MKKNLLLYLLVFSLTNLSGQSYYVVNFTGTGANPETVSVVNQTQGTSVNMQGDDLLHLILPGTNVNESEMGNQYLKIYPNPMDEMCYFEFFNAVHGLVSIHLFSAEGRQIHNFSRELSTGAHGFQLSGLQAGIYFLNIHTETENFSGRFVSTSRSNSNFSLTHINETPIRSGNDAPLDKLLTKDQKLNKGTMAIVEMNYTIGDQLRFIGMASSYTNDTVFSSPTGNQTIHFIFVEQFLCGVSTVTFIYNGVQVTYGTILRSSNRCWLDRNLGATQVATSSTDTASYGDLYQWGRGTDGHQIRTSDTTTTLSTTDAPGHVNFIASKNYPYDWRSPQNNNLWQVVSGINNPCPSGYRLPTEEEWNLERLSWSSNNSAGAFASPLKLTVGGLRFYNSGSLGYVGSSGHYCSSTIDGINSRGLGFSSSGAVMENGIRASGRSVRCIKENPLVPTVTTNAISSVTITTASSGGNVTSDGGAPVTARGVCYSTFPYPTIVNATTSNGTGIGSFTTNITGLISGTTYYVRAYATNSAGTSYGNEVSFTTLDACYGVAAPSGYGIVSSSGKCWLDRNLGATQVATSSTDTASYGDLYQWGRGTDGHQIRTSGTTTVLSSTDLPGHGNFITPVSNPFDWRSSQNNGLWQGVSGVNNPCPTGFRLPTNHEWYLERLSWSHNNAVGAFNSPLKLPMAGSRMPNNGSFQDVGSYGNYWSSTFDSAYMRYLNFLTSNANEYSSYRARGFSVRCLKD
jgi:hypothetical protein